MHAAVPFPAERLAHVMLPHQKALPAFACRHTPHSAGGRSLRDLHHCSSSCNIRLRLFFPLACRRWKRILQHPASLQTLFSEVCIDFGHEVITAVHTPIAWSDRRPSDDEFRDSFAVRACVIAGCARGLAISASRVGCLSSKTSDQ